ncbi:MAG: lectin, partial [Bradyrhizobiaceae bacterium]|nr:lectin [Bradyrhizobiaceae bacterium]
GAVIAKNVDDLHANPNINKETLLDEKGERIKVRGDTPNMHDMLTGSDMQGRAYPSNMNLTCNNWKSSSYGSAMLGHGDREGIADTVYQHSPFAAHMSRDCSQAGLIATGGNGLFYCFAVQ